MLILEMFFTLVLRLGRNAAIKKPRFQNLRYDKNEVTLTVSQDMKNTLSSICTKVTN